MWALLIKPPVLADGSIQANGIIHQRSAKDQP